MRNVCSERKQNIDNSNKCNNCNNTTQDVICNICGFEMENAMKPDYFDKKKYRSTFDLNPAKT